MSNTTFKILNITAVNNTVIQIKVPLAEMKCLHLLTKFGESRGATLMKKSSGDCTVGEEIYHLLDKLVIKGLIVKRDAKVQVFDDDWIEYTVYKLNDVVIGIDDKLNQMK